MSRALALPLCLVAACGLAEQPSGGKPDRPRGVDPRRATYPIKQPGDVAQAEAAPTPPADFPGAAPEPETPTAAAVTTGDEPSEPPAPEEPERDLSAELRAALAGAVGCVGVREAGEGPDQLSFTASVTFTGTGTATRAEVSAHGLTEPERLCVRKRALGVHLAGPIDAAPRTVSTTFTLNRQR